MPFGLLSQVCHAACNSSSFLTAASVSFTPLRSLLPSFRFITPRSQHLNCFRLGIPLSQHISQHKGCTSLSQAIATILTGFHSASLRHPFTSVAFSPPAANNFARRLSPLRLRSLKCCANTQTLTDGSFVPHFAMQH